MIFRPPLGIIQWEPRLEQPDIPIGLPAVDAPESLSLLRLLQADVPALPQAENPRTVPGLHPVHPPGAEQVDLLRHPLAYGGLPLLSLPLPLFPFFHCLFDRESVHVQVKELGGGHDVMALGYPHHIQD
jgi:hypothetical protein